MAMRPLIVIGVAGLTFLGFVLAMHLRAHAMLAGEEEALARIQEFSRAERTRDEDGYRFGWVSEGDLPALFVASPVEHASDGVRWFATRDGDSVYQFDTVVHRTRQNRPNLDKLRHYFARPPEERERLPFGWQKVK